MLRIVVYIALLCASFSATSQIKKNDLASDQAIKQAVREQLKDPDSARFTDMHSIRDIAGFLHTCGMVNAKNSYGGYAGPKPFYALSTGQKVAHAMVATDEKWHVEFVSNRCSDTVIAEQNAALMKQGEEAAEEERDERKARCKASKQQHEQPYCGELLHKCNSYANHPNSIEQPAFPRFLVYWKPVEVQKFLNYCRRNGYEAATTKWYVPGIPTE